MDTHTEQSHTNKLHELCRTCGGRALTVKQKRHEKPVKCERWKNDILLIFGLSIKDDQLNKHSSIICRSCVDMIRIVRKFSRESTIIRARNAVQNSSSIWTEFQAELSINDCPSCSKFISSTIGRINWPKNTVIAPPTVDSIKVTASTAIMSDAIDTTQRSPFPTVGTLLTSDLPASVSPSDAITTNQRTPVETMGTLLTSDLPVGVSASDAITTNQITPVTAMDTLTLSELPVSVSASDAITTNQLTPVLAMDTLTLSDLPANASDDDIFENMTTLHMDMHSISDNDISNHKCIPNVSASNSSRSQEEISVISSPIATSTPTKQTKVMVDTMTSPAFKNDRLFAQSLGKKRTEPLSNHEKELNTQLNRRLLYNSNDIIECKTGGQPIVLAKIRKPRKETSNVSVRTIRSRSQTLSNIRSIVAGSSHKSTLDQKVAELKRIEFSDRYTICREAGIKLNPLMSSEEVIAMKETTDLSWSQLRHQKRFFKHVGYPLPNEKKLRHSMKDLSVTNIKTDLMEFVDSSGNKKARYFVG